MKIDVDGINTRPGSREARPLSSTLEDVYTGMLEAIPSRIPILSGYELHWEQHG